MATITQETRFDLAKSELITLSEIPDHVLNCKRGELWITVDGDRRDIILAPGESWRIESRETVVITALKASTLNVAHCQAYAPRMAGARSLLVSLLQWEVPPLSSFPSPLIR